MRIRFTYSPELPGSPSLVIRWKNISTESLNGYWCNSKIWYTVHILWPSKRVAFGPVERIFELGSSQSKRSMTCHFFKNSETQITLIQIRDWVISKKSRIILHHKGRSCRVVWGTKKIPGLPPAWAIFKNTFLGQKFQLIYASDSFFQ